MTEGLRAGAVRAGVEAEPGEMALQRARCRPCTLGGAGLPPLDRTPLYAASWLSQDSSNSWGDAYPRELWSRSLLYHKTHSNIGSLASSFVAT